MTLDEVKTLYKNTLGKLKIIRGINIERWQTNSWATVNLYLNVYYPSKEEQAANKQVIKDFFTPLIKGTKDGMRVWANVGNPRITLVMAVAPTPVPWDIRPENPDLACALMTIMETLK